MCDRKDVERCIDKVREELNKTTTSEIKIRYAQLNSSDQLSEYGLRELEALQNELSWREDEINGKVPRITPKKYLNK